MTDSAPMNAPIDLTPAEREFLESIKFDTGLPRDEETRKNGKASTSLMKSLIARKAIPEVRLKYFTDADYLPGSKGRSRQQVIEEKGRFGDEIFSDPNFLKFLQYFIHGAALPSHVVEEFRTTVESCGDVTSSDVPPLGKTARQLARATHMTARDASEEFYKLALECGVWHSYAEHIRSAVRQIR